MKTTKVFVLFTMMVFLVFGGMLFAETKDDVEVGWKVFKLSDFSVAFPKGWSGDMEVQVFGPGKVDMSRGMPALRVHCGAFPIISGKTLLTTMKMKTQGKTENVKVTISGLSGYISTWGYMSGKSIGGFLEEKISGNMGMMYFVVCRAPKDKYDEYKETFEKIIKSFRK